MRRNRIPSLSTIIDIYHVPEPYVLEPYETVDRERERDRSGGKWLPLSTTKLEFAGIFRMFFIVDHVTA